MILSEKSNDQTVNQPALNPILLLGIGLGLFADLLWWSGDRIGLGFALWVSLFGLSACLVVGKSNAAGQKEILVWSLVSSAAAIVLLFRTTPIVIVAMLLIVLASSAMAIMQKNGKPLRETIVLDYLVSLRSLPSRCLLAAIPLWRQIDFSAHIADPRLRSFSRGALLAAPIIVVFTCLFSSADVVFARYVLRAINFFSPMTLRHLLVTFVLGWVATGLLVGVSENHLQSRRPPRKWLSLGTHDTAAFLGSVAVLFLVFVYAQLGYLFGGREVIDSTVGLTVAEYARSGFFELLAVAALTIMLLIAVASTECDRRVFRPLGAVLIACVMIILASAAQRMWLYVTEFGLTIDRLTAIAVIAWLAFSLLLFAATVLRDRTKDFAIGLIISGIAVAFALAIANPARIVAETNVTRGKQIGEDADVPYLLSLGSDALPILVEKIDFLSDLASCQAAMHLAQYRAKLAASSDWRHWNVSDSVARNAILENEQKLGEIIELCSGYHFGY